MRVTRDDKDSGGGDDVRDEQTDGEVARWRSGYGDGDYAQDYAQDCAQDCVQNSPRSVETVRAAEASGTASRSNSEGGKESIFSVPVVYLWFYSSLLCSSDLGPDGHSCTHIAQGPSYVGYVGCVDQHWS